MRALEPVRTGLADSGGVPIYWEEFGGGDRTRLFVPPWQITHSRIDKMQVPYLARAFRVLTYDPPGAGRSGRPPTGYDLDRGAADALAVLDATGMPAASLVCKSRSAWYGVILAAEHPERVERLVLLAPALAEGSRGGAHFHTPRDRYEGWQKYNAYYWREHYADFVTFFYEQLLSEPHSTKGIEDGVAWGLETTPEILIATVDEWRCRTPLADLLARVRVPTLIIHGTEDRIRPFAIAEQVHAAIAGSRLVAFEGAGHGPGLRHPVRTNLLLRDFLGAPVARRQSWHRALGRRRRALFISSPIGLGHALRDVAVAGELRALDPDLEIQWLAQDPVTRVLEARGETVHPASRLLAGESAHVESEAGEHDRHDLHENPELKTAFGPGLPEIRDWTAAHYDFTGYVLPFDPGEFADREAVRARLGFRPDETLVFAAVGARARVPAVRARPLRAPGRAARLPVPGQRARAGERDRAGGHARRGRSADRPPAPVRADSRGGPRTRRGPPRAGRGDRAAQATHDRGRPARVRLQDPRRRAARHLPPEPAADAAAPSGLRGAVSRRPGSRSPPSCRPGPRRRP
jgi:pimeloyl-ACP methyl ester carboxylesterase